jgi:hypothetical protein
MDDDFMDGWVEENRVSAQDAAWYSWIEAVETILGGPFEAVTGLSMDWAYEAWERHLDAAEYAAHPTTN